LKKEKEGNWKLEKFEESLKKKKEGRKRRRFFWVNVVKIGC
jgi:hypothetical protein